MCHGDNLVGCRLFNAVLFFSLLKGQIFSDMFQFWQKHASACCPFHIYADLMINDHKCIPNNHTEDDSLWQLKQPVQAFTNNQTSTQGLCLLPPEKSKRHCTETCPQVFSSTGRNFSFPGYCIPWHSFNHRIFPLSKTYVCRNMMFHLETLNKMRHHWSVNLGLKCQKCCDLRAFFRGFSVCWYWSV